MARKPRKSVIIEALNKTGGIVKPAAEKLQVTRQTLSRWIKNDPTLKEAQLDARESVVDLAESGLVHNLTKKKEATIFFTLKTLGKDRGYVEKQIIELDKDTEILIGYDDPDDEN